MFLGRLQLGQWLDLNLQCGDANHTPAIPVDCPMMTIRRASDSVAVYTKEMPITEKQGVPIGLFTAKVFLGSAFNVGQYTVEIAYTVGSFTDVQTRTFRIIESGNPNGQVIGMAFFRRPNRDNILYQTESGRILRGSNPRTT